MKYIYINEIYIIYMLYISIYIAYIYIYIVYICMIETDTACSKASFL